MFYRESEWRQCIKSSFSLTYWLNVTNFQVLLAKADVQLLSDSQLLKYLPSNMAGAVFYQHKLKVHTPKIHIVRECHDMRHNL